MLGLVISKNVQPEQAAQLRPPQTVLLPVAVSLKLHRKYLSPAFRRERVDPELARRLGEALLEAGAVSIINAGPASPEDKADGLSTLTISVTAINPLSSLYKVVF